MIDSYKFGVVIISQKRYTSDVIVFPERVIDNWWRKEGHELCVKDLKVVFSHEPTPDVIIVGTGYHGIMKVLPEVENILKSHGIELLAQPTREACQTFNNLLRSNRKVVGAFHLTC